MISCPIQKSSSWWFVSPSSDMMLIMEPSRGTGTECVVEEWPEIGMPGRRIGVFGTSAISNWEYSQDSQSVVTNLNLTPFAVRSKAKLVEVRQMVIQIGHFIKSPVTNIGGAGTWGRYSEVSNRCERLLDYEQHDFRMRGCELHYEWHRKISCSLSAHDVSP